MKMAKRNKDTAIPEVLLLSRSEVEELLNMDEILKAVEHAFRLEAEGKIIMPPKLYLVNAKVKGAQGA